MGRTVCILALVLPLGGACDSTIETDGEFAGTDGSVDQPDSPDAATAAEPDAGATQAIVFGNVPKPDVYVSHLNGAGHPMMGYSDSSIAVEGVVWHRMVGTLWGTDSWFHQGMAATEYGIGVAATDGVNSAGQIIEWIDPANGHWYGHASGPVSQPYGDGLRFVNRFGVNRVNPQTVAIEISGNYGTPLDDAARESLIALTAYFADQRQIPWSEFPNVPGEERSFVLWHQEFTIGTGKVCPGDVVIGETSPLIDEVAEYLRIYQEQAGPQ